MILRPTHLTREEAAAAGRCSRDSIDRLIRSGELEATKFKKRVLVSRESVVRWLSGTAAPTKEAAAQSR